MAINALYPLIDFNIKNIKEKGIIDSLTGPVERGDLSTVIKHCNVLEEKDSELYKLLSIDILEIAKLKNVKETMKI